MRGISPCWILFLSQFLSGPRKDSFTKVSRGNETSRGITLLKTKMATMTAGTHDASYIGLLGLAETFRTSNPPRIRQCIQCLQSVFQFQPSPAIQARTHLQLGKLLHSYTKNTDMARSHLEKAVSLTIVSLLY